MRFQVVVPTILGIFLTLVTLSGCLDASYKYGLEYFRNNIFHEIEKTNEHTNIIFSPFSAQTCLAMVRMGAAGETGDEMDRAMGLNGERLRVIAENYFALLSRYENSNLLHLANKVYVMIGYELQDNYRGILSEYFLSAAESINFGHNIEAANSINKWVESKTNYLIKNLITPDLLDSNTRLVVLNAIHFKGEWLKAFDVKQTKVGDFHIDQTNVVKVPMMSNEDYYEFANLPEINATALRLPYKDSDLSMLILLPYEYTGLRHMENQLKHTRLESLSSKFSEIMVYVTLPKFKADLTMNLNENLKKLNMQHMFENADFSNMLASPEQLSVSQVIQKACIEVTEKGTEAAAVTGAAVDFRTMSPDFNADHPFHYFILNTENVVLFEGNVVNFETV